MKTPGTEALDLAITQAMERYIEMKPHEAHEAIALEWPEQIAVLLEETFFKSTCGNNNGMTDFVQIERNNGHSYYVVPICGCDLKLPSRTIDDF